MNSVLLSLALAASLALPYSIHAADELSEGTVKNVDAAGRRIMLAHGPIANLGMMPMTMMFQVRDAAMLGQVKAGDKVRFRVEALGGAYTIVRIEAAKSP